MCFLSYSSPDASTIFAHVCKGVDTLGLQLAHKIRYLLFKSIVLLRKFAARKWHQIDMHGSYMWNQHAFIMCIEDRKMQTMTLPLKGCPTNSFLLFEQV